jgi:hypothetical protein
MAVEWIVRELTLMEWEAGSYWRNREVDCGKRIGNRRRAVERRHVSAEVVEELLHKLVPVGSDRVP